MRRFYFTDDDGNNIGNDYCGNIRGARTQAKKLAEEYKVDCIIINESKEDYDDIVDFVYA